MKVVSHSDPDFSDQINRLLAPSSLFDPIIEQQTRDIINAVRTRGDKAVAELTAHFHGPKLDPDQFAVTQAEWLSAYVQADSTLRNAVAETRKNVKNFANRSLRKGWSTGRLWGKNLIPWAGWAFTFRAGWPRWCPRRS